MSNFVHIIAEIIVRIVAHVLNGAREERAERSRDEEGGSPRSRRARGKDGASVDASAEE